MRLVPTTDNLGVIVFVCEALATIIVIIMIIINRAERLAAYDLSDVVIKFSSKFVRIFGNVNNPMATARLRPCIHSKGNKVNLFKGVSWSFKRLRPYLTACTLLLTSTTPTDTYVVWPITVASSSYLYGT